MRFARLAFGIERQCRPRFKARALGPRLAGRRGCLPAHALLANVYRPAGRPHEMNIRSLGLTFVASIALHGAAIAQDVAAGEKVFAKCKVCHQVGESVKNGVGPVLNGIVGRKAGSVESFPRSKNKVNTHRRWGLPQSVAAIFSASDHVAERVDVVCSDIAMGGLKGVQCRGVAIPKGTTLCDFSRRTARSEEAHYFSSKCPLLPK